MTVSALLAGGLAGSYIAALLGLHRWNVGRMRRQAAGFPALRRVAWGALLGGLVPGPHPVEVELRLPDGGPVPPVLAPREGEAEPARRAFLRKLVFSTEDELDEDDALEVGFSGGEARWLATLAVFKRRPEQALERLEGATATSGAEIYLREYLGLSVRTHALNLELNVFAARRRLTAALSRFGDDPALYFVRALATSMIGFNRAAVDDMARAVYYSRQDPFYLHAVLDTPYIEEVRPPLAFQCRQALDVLVAARKTPSDG